MRVLMLSPTVLFPTDNGARRRIRSLAEGVSRRHEVTVLALGPRVGAKALNPSAFLPCCSYHVSGHRRGRLHAALWSAVTGRSYREGLCNSRRFHCQVARTVSEATFDLVWCHFLTLAASLGPVAIPRHTRHSPVLVLDQHNVDEVVWERVASSAESRFLRFFARRQLVRARRLQSWGFPRFDAILSVSSEDAERSRRYSGASTPCWLVPNGADTAYFGLAGIRQNVGTDPLVIFGGSMDVAMNCDAVLWFTREILPGIRRRFPDVRFRVVGRRPAGKIRRLSYDAGVELTGEVTDVREHYRLADVFVVPSRFGGGTKLKTVEAMSMGLPLVATSIGVQGLGAVSGQHCQIADNALAFGEAVIELLTNREFAAALGRNARDHICERFDWGHITEEVLVRVEGLVDARRGFNAGAASDGDESSCT